MSKLSEWGRRFWFKVELAAPSIIQRTVVPRLYEAKDMLTLLFKPYLTIWQWQGQSEQGSLVVNYAGSGQAKAFLKDLFFKENPIEKKQGEIPIWHLSKLSELSTGDITIVEANARLIKRLSSPNAVVLPVFLSMVLNTKGDWQQVKDSLRKSVRSELRLTRKYGYELEVSKSVQDFETFYHKMYLPTMETRHADQAAPTSRDEAFQYFKHGLLFFVVRDGQRVAGSICYIEQDIVHLILMGVVGGDQQLMREGVVGALNYLRIQWVYENNYRGIDFGWYRPFMTNLFRNKRKWGATAVIPDNSNRQFWLKFHHNTPAVTHFMTNNVCIIIKDGQLCGLLTIDGDDTASLEKEDLWYKQTETPGLKGLFIRSVEDFFKPTDGTDIAQTKLIVF